VAQPLHFHLTGVGKAALVDQATNTDEVLFLVGVANLMLELIADIEVVFERALATPGDHGDLREPCRQRLLYPVLDQRLVHHRQHFLGHGLGCGEKTGAISGSGKKAFLDHVSP